MSRDETAALADIGTSWYARLEAGRVAQPTLATMRAIARALRLDPYEERFVLELAGLLPASAPEDGRLALPDPLLELFSDTSLTSVIVFDKFLAPVGWNALADGVHGFWDVPTIIDRNPVARLDDEKIIAFFGDDYEAYARGIVGLFRRAYVAAKDSLYAQQVYARANETAIFRKHWAAHVVAGGVSDPRRPFVRHHWAVGTYTATAIDLLVPDETVRVRIVSPADDESRAKFVKLRARGRSSVAV